MLDSNKTLAKSDKIDGHLMSLWGVGLGQVKRLNLPPPGYLNFGIMARPGYKM